MPRLYFADDLFGRLETHLPAVHHDDVAELAGERAAARALDDPVRVAAVEHIEPWRGRVGQVNLVGLDVMVTVLAGGELAQEPRPGVLGLALEQHVAVRAAGLGHQVRHRPADDDHRATRPESIGNLEHAGHLDDVPGNRHHVRVGLVVHDLARVFVAQRDREFVRRQGRQGEQSERRKDGIVRRQHDEVLEAPVRGRKSGRDEVNARTGLGVDGAAGCSRVAGRHLRPSAVKAALPILRPQTAAKERHKLSVCKCAGQRRYAAGKGGADDAAEPLVIDGFVTMSDGCKLYFQRHGSGGETVIVPNGLFYATDWQRLATNRTVVFYDVRNRGRSDATNDPAAARQGHSRRR